MATATKNRISANGHATNGKAQVVEEVKLREIDIREFTIPIKGVTPLIVHKFSEKARKQIEDKQQQKAKGGRAKRDPKQEFLAAIYLMPGSMPALHKGAKYGIPAAGFKKAAVSAGRYVDGLNMTFLKGAFYVLDDGGGLVLLDTKKKHPTMREDTVRIGNGNTLDLRYRPEFTEWSCKLRIRYNTSCISAEQIVNMFAHAGFHIGMCELRNEKGAGCNGAFEVEGKRL